MNCCDTAAAPPPHVVKDMNEQERRDAESKAAQSRIDVAREQAKKDQKDAANAEQKQQGKQPKPPAPPAPKEAA